MKTGARRTIHLVGLAVLTLCLGGCAALPTAIVPTRPMSDRTAAQPAPLDGWAELRLRTPYPYTTPLPPPAPTPLDGTYVKTDPRAGDQIPCRRCPPYPPAGGLWRLSLKRGTFRIYHAGTGWRSLGSYSVAGERITFFNDPHCTDAVGVYDWKVDSGELRLRQVEDTCGGVLRAQSLTDRPWLSCQPPSAEAATTDHWPRPPGCPGQSVDDTARCQALAEIERGRYNRRSVMSDPTQPVVVKLDREARTVHVEWQDGHQSTYSWEGLRATCPCVECRGGHAAMAAGIDPELMRDPPASPWCIERLRQVGNYALGILWDDGHDTGIYAWHVLRELCPCDACVEQDAEGDQSSVSSNQ